MSSINITDEIQAPKGATVVKFSGKNPFVVVTMIPKLLRYVMKLSGKDIHERDIRWDTTSDPREYYGYWTGQRTEDTWTKSKVTVIAQGTQDIKTGEGSIRIELKGTVSTTYDYANFLQRSFWWFFNRTFYFKQRRRYIDYATDNILTIRSKIMDELGIMKDEFITKNEMRG